MKTLNLTMTALMLVTLLACAQKETKQTELQSTLSRTNVIATNQKDISDIKNQLDSLSDRTFATKFRDSQSRERSKFIKEEYANLDRAHEELEQIKPSLNETEFNAKQAQLNQRLASIRKRINERRSE